MTVSVPAVVLDVDLAEEVPYIPPVTEDGGRVEQAWLLVRVFTEPLGFVVCDVPAAGLSATAVREAITAEYGDVARAKLAAPEYLARREAVLRSAPPITVVVCTRERPESLSRCLDSLLAQEYPRYRVLVVDNAPVSDETERVVKEAARRGPVDYLVEPAPGLSRARNRAVAAAPGETLAWIDDDEVADAYWLSELARAFTEHPEADVVSGVIVPAELSTKAQLWFEQFGGHSKGRGFASAVFSARTTRQSPLFPLPPFGTGANMAFRPGVIEGIRGFDTALGAGTPAQGGEDTLAFTQVLLRGGTIVYQPTALVRHFHRDGLDGLRRQLYGYGVGLTAYYTRLALDPRNLVPLMRLVPTALRELRGKGGLRVAGIGADFPADLLSANRRGMLYGPLAYVRGRLWKRRATTPAP